jgi:hypothetical protein
MDLLIGKKVVPLGVIAIIYEARPNVTVDSAAYVLNLAMWFCFEEDPRLIIRTYVLQKLFPKQQSKMDFLKGHSNY